MRAPLAVLAVALLVLAACQSTPTETPPPCPTGAPTAADVPAILEGAATVTVSVSGAAEGEFTIALHGAEAPIATANFVSLARCGFYDGVWFHRILAGFVIQAGDPGTKSNDGDFAGLGTGGPGYDFEIEPPGDGLRFDPYTVAMANDTVANGSQWFVTLADLDEHLRGVGVYTIFGTVTAGTEVVDAIAAIPVNDPRVGVPLQRVTIEAITVSDVAPEPSD